MEGKKISESRVIIAQAMNQVDSADVNTLPIAVHLRWMVSFDKSAVSVYIILKSKFKGGVTVSTGTFEVVEAYRGSYRPR